MLYFHASQKHHIMNYLTLKGCRNILFFKLRSGKKYKYVKNINKLMLHDL